MLTFQCMGWKEFIEADFLMAKCPFQHQPIPNSKQDNISQWLDM